VYRARDTKLNRDVAIKVLPAEVAADPARLARFQREAQLLASLNHPNIAAIHGLEEAEGKPFLILELVEGEDLAERLKRGAIPVEEAIEFAKQIAEALEEAHERGIIHRDLKPANIKLTPDGKVKVLDFGLAKAYAGEAAAAPSADVSQSPTLAHQGTQAGLILGTAAYMSPEQARGTPVDKRADIWAFGVVLFEMLTGKPLFAGETVSDVLAGVLKTEIDIGRLPESTPSPIRGLLRRCLQRRPQDRLRDIGDARLQVAECLAGTLDDTVSRTSDTPPRMAAAKRWLPIVAAGAALCGLLGYMLGTTRATGAASASGIEQRFVIPAAGRSVDDRQAIAPDGTRLAYTAAGGLWLRALGEVEPRRITGGDGAREPFWSPDSREIGFVREHALWRIAIEGGAAKRVCEIPAGTFDGGTWGEDGTVTFAVATGGWSGNLLQCAASGGTARPLHEPESVGLRFRRPQALPRKAGVLYVLDDHSERGEIRILRDGASRTLLRLPMSVGSAALAADGRLYFSQDRSIGVDLWSVALDERLEKPLGEPTVLAEGGALPSVARDGALLLALVENPPQRLAWAHRDGSTAAVGETFDVDPDDVVIQLSPDGGRASLFLGESPTSQLWIADLARGTRQRLPLDFGAYQAIWSPDGREMAVVGEKETLVADFGGGGAARKLTPGHTMFQPRYAPDGRWIVYYVVGAASGRDIWRIEATGKSGSEPLVGGSGQQVDPDVSPDGRFLAYQSDESGRPEIYVRPYPAGDRKWQVSTAGGAAPCWNRRGGELVWLAENAIWAAAVRTAAGEFEAGGPRLVVRGEAIGADLSSGLATYNRMYDLSPDGRRFLVAQSAGAGRNEMVYVENPGGGGPPR